MSNALLTDDPAMLLGLFSNDALRGLAGRNNQVANVMAPLPVAPFLGTARPTGRRRFLGHAKLWGQNGHNASGLDRCLPTLRPVGEVAPGTKAGGADGGASRDSRA
jgi:hypothetical protein